MSSDLEYQSESSRSESSAYLQQEIKNPEITFIHNQVQGNEVKMLVITNKNEQRLITFEIPEGYDTTVQDLLEQGMEQGRISTGAKTTIFFIEDTSLIGINYLVENSEYNTCYFCLMDSQNVNHSLKSIKKQKSELNDNLATNDIININHYLNDDCLLNIFGYLPLREKLAVELVCKRWRNLKEFLWIKNKSFEISQRMMISLIERTDEISFDCKERRDFIYNVLKNSGPYLNHLTVMNDLNWNYQILLEEIAKHSKNLINLKLVKKRIHFPFFNDEDLAKLFESNKKISNISFDKVVMVGKCLLNLNADLISEIYINDCTFYSDEYLYDFLSKLKNLKIFKFTQALNSNKLILALDKSNCESIREFCVAPYGNVVQLSQFIAKQKNLQKLTGSYGRDLLDILPVDLFQETDLNVNDYNSKSLSRFKNLINIDCKMDLLTDEILKNLSKCFYLKKLCLLVKTYSLTPEGEKNFGLFKNLESLSIICTDHGTDYFLNAVSNCKSLKELIINSKKGIILKFTSLITKLTNLQKLTLYGQCNFSNAFYKNVNDLKTKRGDTHILEFQFHETCSYTASIEQEVINKLPLISLKFGVHFNFADDLLKRFFKI